MGVRVLRYEKAGRQLDTPVLLRELDVLGPLVAAEGARLRAGLAAAGGAVDTKNDPHIARLRGHLWRIAELIRRGEPVTYVSVVKDVHEQPSGKRRIVTLESFGRDSPETDVRANLFASAYMSAVVQRRAFGARPLSADEANAIREAYGTLLGAQWTACIINGDDEVLYGASQSLNGFP